jgi:hypothetical protein
VANEEAAESIMTRRRLDHDIGDIHDNETPTIFRGNNE